MCLEHRVEAIVPDCLAGGVLAKALQNQPTLIMFNASKLLAVVLKRLKRTLEFATHSSAHVGFDKALLAAVRLRLPEPSVVVAALSALEKLEARWDLAEATLLGVLADYQLIFPEWAATFDAGRFVPTPAQLPTLTRAVQLAQLQLVNISQQVQWEHSVKGAAIAVGKKPDGKPLPHNFSRFGCLLALFATSADADVRAACRQVVHKVMMSTGVFDQHAWELDLWLDSLPSDPIAAAVVDATVIGLLKQVLKAITLHQAAIVATQLKLQGGDEEDEDSDGMDEALDTSMEEEGQSVSAFITAIHQQLQRVTQTYSNDHRQASTVIYFAGMALQLGALCENALCWHLLDTLADAAGPLVNALLTAPSIALVELLQPAADVKFAIDAAQEAEADQLVKGWAGNLSPLHQARLAFGIMACQEAQLWTLIQLPALGSLASHSIVAAALCLRMRCVQKMGDECIPSVSRVDCFLRLLALQPEMLHSEPVQKALDSALGATPATLLYMPLLDLVALLPTLRERVHAASTAVEQSSINSLLLRVATAARTVLPHRLPLLQALLQQSLLNLLSASPVGLQSCYDAHCMLLDLCTAPQCHAIRDQHLVELTTLCFGLPDSADAMVWIENRGVSLQVQVVCALLLAAIAQLPTQAVRMLAGLVFVNNELALRDGSLTSVGLLFLELLLQRSHDIDVGTSDLLGFLEVLEDTASSDDALRLVDTVLRFAVEPLQRSEQVNVASRAGMAAAKG